MIDFLGSHQQSQQQIQPTAVAEQFHISVTPLGEGHQYFLRTELADVDAGLAEERVVLPVEQWLAAAQTLMYDPLLGLLGGQELSQNGLTPSLLELGQELYNGLFQGKIRDSWIRAQALAQRQGSVLRLRLGLKDDLLPRLPWEVINAGARPLATGTDIAFSRYQANLHLRLPPSVVAPRTSSSIQILMVLSAPTDREHLALKQEALHLQTELQNRARGGLPPIQLTLLEQPGREQLTQALEQSKYHIFHYAGHSNLGAEGGELYLVNRRTGLTETLRGDDLAGLLANNGILMAVFNSCYGSYSANAPLQGESNLAQALIRRGIPSVLAMAERIPDDVALTVAQLFYRNLSQGYPIDLSLNRARQGLISAYGSQQLYWALPILYLAPEFDGYLTVAHQEKRSAVEVLPTPGIEEDTDEITHFPSPDPYLEEDEFLDDAELTDDDFFALDTGNGESDDLAAEDGLDDWIGHLVQQNSAPPPAPAPTTPPVEDPPESPPLPGTASPGLQVTMEQAQKSLPKPRKGNKPLIPLMAAGAVFTTMAGGVLLWQGGFLGGGNLSQTPDISVSVPPMASLNAKDLKAANTASVTALAIENLSQGKLPAAQTAIEELLDRGALQQAEAALAAVPAPQIDQPIVSFLRGRLAWQAVQTGDRKFSVSDARRYWEVAARQSPKSPQYLNALGFAYYAEKNYTRANQVWFDAFYLIEEQQVQPQQTASPPAANPVTLNTYAGLSLGLWKSAASQSPSRREKLLNESSKLKQLVMRQDPVGFQAEALSKNWLWTAAMIQDWRTHSASTAQSGTNAAPPPDSAKN